jgi:ornithine cyclodeaminase
LRSLVPMRDAIVAVEEAFVAVADGTAEQPPRLVTGDGTVLAMLARRSANGAADGGTSFKAISVSQANRGSRSPTIHAIVLWFDGRTGRPRLLVEGAALTALRTGAAAGVATRLLASPTSSTLALIGAGAQAADQVRAVCATRAITEVRIFSPSASAERLVERLAGELPDVRLRRASSARAAVDGADVVCCATDSATPVLPADAVGERVHVNGIGSYLPTMRELPIELLARADVVAVDSRAAAMAEAGEIIDAVGAGRIAEEELVEIGVLVATPPPPPTGLTIFKSVGVAMQDWAICRLLEQRLPAGAQAVDLGAGS